MMTVVADTPVLFWLYSITPPLRELLDDTFYPAMNSVTQTWDAGPAPKIDVDLKSGFPITSELPRKPGALTGTVGGEPKVRMELRSDDGTIEILTSTSSVSD
jgi:hypothetical protein